MAIVHACWDDDPDPPHLPGRAAPSALPAWRADEVTSPATSRARFCSHEPGETTTPHPLHLPGAVALVAGSPRRARSPPAALASPADLGARYLYLPRQVRDDIFQPKLKTIGQVGALCGTLSALPKELPEQIVDSAEPRAQVAEYL